MIWAEVELPDERPSTWYVRIDGLIMAWKYGEWSFCCEGDKLARHALGKTAEEAMDWIDKHLPLKITKAERLYFEV